MSTIVEITLAHLTAKDIVAKRAEQLEDVLEVITSPEGTFTVYYDRTNRNRARRAEIILKNGAVIKIFKDTHAEGTSDAFTLDARFQRIELVQGDETQVLTVKIDPRTSPFNPGYLFVDGETVIGSGHGQHLDEKIASELLRINIGGDDVARGVTDWIKSKLSRVG